MGHLCSIKTLDFACDDCANPFARRSPGQIEQALFPAWRGSVFIEKIDHRTGNLPRKRHPHHGDRARARAAHHALSRARPRAESHHGEHTCLAMSGPERPSKRTAPLGYPSGAAGIRLAASLPNSMNQHRGISRRRTVSRCKSTKPYLITRTRRTPSMSHSLLMMSSVTETSRSSMV